MPDKNLITYNVVKLCKTLNIPIPTKAQTLGRLGEVLAYKYFLERGHSVRWQCATRQYADYDLLVDGQMVEVKTSLANQKRKFTFIFTKNRYPNGTLIADKVILVFLDSVEAPPNFMVLTRKEVPDTTGFNGTIATLSIKFPGKLT